MPGSGLSKGTGDEDSSTSKVKIRTKRETDTNIWKRDGITPMMDFRLGTYGGPFANLDSGLDMRSNERVNQGSWD